MNDKEGVKIKIKLHAIREEIRFLKNDIKALEDKEKALSEGL